MDTHTVLVATRCVAHIREAAGARPLGATRGAGESARASDYPPVVSERSVRRWPPRCSSPRPKFSGTLTFRAGQRCGTDPGWWSSVCAPRLPPLREVGCDGALRARTVRRPAARRDLRARRHDGPHHGHDRGRRRACATRGSSPLAGHFRLGESLEAYLSLLRAAADARAAPAEQACGCPGCWCRSAAWGCV